MVEQGLLYVAAGVAALSVPYALLCAVYLTGADDDANNALAAMLGVLLVPASIASLLAVLALVRGDPWPSTQVVVLAPAVLAAVAGPFGGPRSMHRATQHTGDVMTSEGYFRPGDPGYPQKEPPSRSRRLTEVAKMVGLFLLTPALVVAAQVLT